MSVSTETRVPDLPTPRTLPAQATCAHCHARLAEEQEWCLECGAARTLIHRPADWRIPVAIIAGVLLLAFMCLAIALINLSRSADQPAQTQTARNAQATPARKSASAPATPTFAGWPTGLSGWTVVFAQRHKQARAAAIASRLQAGGIRVGILNSNDHPSMKPGYWVVFSGRYPDQASAASAATKLRAQGRRRATARRVAPPGGI